MGWGRYRHGECNTKLYHIWANMKNRCSNPNHSKFQYYGGKGITVDPKWQDFLKFKEDMHFKFIYAKKKYKTEDLSIEREDTNKNYCMENCSFIPKNQQNWNTGKNREFTAINLKTGEKIIAKDQRKFARDHGFTYSTIWKILNNYMCCKTANNGEWTFKYN